MRYDLHVHTTYSDGTKTMAELGALAQGLGLGGFAVTDHDTIAGWEEIAAVETAYNITVFPAVEISSEWEHRDVHILAYGVEDAAGLSESLVFLAESRVKRTEKMVANLNELGFEITMADVIALAGAGTVGRPHIAAALVAKGYVKDKQDAFDRYLGRGKRAYAQRPKYTPFEALALVKKCGGTAVLAHPGLDQAGRLIDNLADAGLAGLEAYHSAHSPELSAKLAKRLGHGDFSSLPAATFTEKTTAVTASSAVWPWKEPSCPWFCNDT